MALGFDEESAIDVVDVTAALIEAVMVCVLPGDKLNVEGDNPLNVGVAPVVPGALTYK